MGKTKRAAKAKERKDVFYKRAKEQGYRARSAYKLIHLNNIHGFLKNAKVCLDLCAAPGSWMQVAREFMNTGSVIIGVDLNSIRPIPGTIGLVGDITTEDTRTRLRDNLKQYKADVVLHDGAPSVGGNWDQDGYDQNVLVLHAFKLACEFLKPGGHFVTKVFRTRDSASLEFVFKSLFAKVECTKPQSSRKESAEIFYVCKSFKLKPGMKVDPKYFDSKEVFKELDPTLTSKINIHRPEKAKKARAIGYEDGVEILVNNTTITEFVNCDNFSELLAKSTALVFDDEKWIEHPLTNQEIIACCEDIRVLGRKDLRMLLTWRKKLRSELDEINGVNAEKEEAEAAPIDEEQENENEVDKVLEQSRLLNEEARRDDKKKERSKKKQKKALQQSLRMMAMSGNDTGDNNSEYFNINDVEKVKDIDALMEQYDMLSDDDEEKDKLKKYIKYKKGDQEIDDTGKFYRAVDSVPGSDSEDSSDDEREEEVTSMKKVDGIEIAAREKPKKSVHFGDETDDESDAEGKDGSDEEDSDDEASKAASKFTTDLVGDDPEEKKIRTAESWFSQDIFKGVDSDEDEDLDLEAAVKKYKEKGGKMFGEEETSLETPLENTDGETVSSDETKPAPVTTNDENKIFKFITKQQLESLKNLQSQLNELCFPGNIESLGFEDIDENASHSERKLSDIHTVDMSDWGEEIIKEPKPQKRLPELDAVGLALAAEMIKTKKTRREFELSGWNRYMKGEEPGLPKWFVEDEASNMLPMNVTVDPEEVKYYKARDMAVNARTIKKVLEARVRKQRRFKKTMNKIIKKTENLQGSSLLTDYEKREEIKNMYKKAMKSQEKKKTEYVVMNKKNQGKAPKGIKGKYKLVDPRMKKDIRAKMKSAKKKKTVGRGKK